MADLVKYYFNTESKILSLLPTDVQWQESAFYYPSDKTYFYQAVGGVMKKYGAPDQPVEVVSNIVANLGIGNLTDAPASQDQNIGDIYVAKDTFMILIINENFNYTAVPLSSTQFVTDVSEATELPPLYQFFNNILMPIANYAPDNELPSLPE